MFVRLCRSITLLGALRVRERSLYTAKGDFLYENK